MLARTTPPARPPAATTTSAPALSALDALVARNWGQARAAMQPGEWDAVQAELLCGADLPTLNGRR
ncbi:hypothetical protein [Deinococcus maricopensis]|uniref:Uncharacterized protein n=1 Tax=Deinococcus maricopensis (strain DSM 21211 / LMG 22137 / NRRL B-23946 / LB-34) TaxID=709986 RepID=E8U426_DEIML|nr:hypothetical protein [Deinococcus maricopensis]ADV65863.1 hypothetical protein Deima_0199 [Deinococcus maricopensis DSM 21211]